MNNLCLLFKENNSSLIKPKNIQNGHFIYPKPLRDISLVTIKEIIRFINSIDKWYSVTHAPIYFDLRNAVFHDKLTYILFECICEYSIEILKHNIRIDGLNAQSGVTILSEGITSSPLLLLSSSNLERRKSYHRKFHSDIYHTHYRKVIPANSNSKEDSLSRYNTDFINFFNAFNVDMGSAYQLSEVIIELAGNAVEHVAADTIVDIDVSGSYFRRGNSTDRYYAVNVVVLNFAAETIGSDIAQKLFSLHLSNQLKGRYSTLHDAYLIHKGFFNDYYSEKDFFHLASFQDRISGRMHNIDTGGKGLTMLISSLEAQSEDHLCYMISGNRQMMFHLDCLGRDKDHWVKFTTTGDFFSTPPSQDVLSYCPFFFPGVAYNLTFVLKEDNGDEEN